MKRMKQTLCLIVFAGIGFFSMNTYANTTNTQTTIEPTAITKTEEKKYVVITQPTSQDIIQTFDSQLNIMGEASVGTEIRIIVYYGEEVENLASVLEKDEYKLKTIGATKTFSQLINLNEGQNNIVIQYQYAGTGGKGNITIQVVRKPESEKEMIKSYMTPQAIVDKIVTPAPGEKSASAPENVASKAQVPAAK